MGKTINTKLFDTINYLVFVVIGLAMIYPLWYVLMASLSGSGKIIINNYYFLPNEFSLKAYSYVLKEANFYVGYKNSIVVTVAGTALSLFMTAIAAYPLAIAKKLPGRQIISSMMVFTMLFSGGIIPTYLLVKSLSLTNTLWALIIPNSISVFYWLVMMKFFNSIPVSLIECAKIDGYNDIAILMKIMLPLSKAALAALALFYAVNYWNIYFNAILYITDQNKRVLQVVLQAMAVESDSLGALDADKSGAVKPMNLRMAAIIVTVLPILTIYPFLQKHFAQGVMLGSVKG